MTGIAMNQALCWVVCTKDILEQVCLDKAALLCKVTAPLHLLICSRPCSLVRSINSESRLSQNPETHPKIQMLPAKFAQRCTAIPRRPPSSTTARQRISRPRPTLAYACPVNGRVLINIMLPAQSTRSISSWLSSASTQSPERFSKTRTSDVEEKTRLCGHHVAVTVRGSCTLWKKIND